MNGRVQHLGRTIDVPRNSLYLNAMDGYNLPTNSVVAHNAQSLEFVVESAKGKLQALINRCNPTFRLTYLEAIQQFFESLRSNIAEANLRHFIISMWGSDCKTSDNGDLMHEIVCSVLPELMSVVDNILTLSHDSLRLEAINRILRSFHTATVALAGGEFGSVFPVPSQSNQKSSAEKAANLTLPFEPTVNLLSETVRFTEGKKKIAKKKQKSKKASKKKNKTHGSKKKKSMAAKKKSSKKIKKTLQKKTKKTVKKAKHKPWL